jgi:hypothetical protein
MSILVALLLALRILTDAPATLDYDDAYETQRNCAFDCSKPLSVASKLSGPTAQVMNDCVCRTDLHYTANRFVSGCVNAWCSEVAYDVSLATKIYNDYRKTNVYIVNKAHVTPTTNSGMLKVGDQSS